MSTTQKTDKADAVRSLLAKLPTNSVTPERKPIIQEIAKEKGKTGRKMHRKEDVTYVRLSPAIPVDLKWMWQSKVNFAMFTPRLILL